MQKPMYWSTVQALPELVLLFGLAEWAQRFKPKSANNMKKKVLLCVFILILPVVILQ